MIKVLIADDHPLIREGLLHVLELDAGLKVVGEAGDGQGAINLTRSLRPDVILMDIKMPGTDGIEASKVISREFPETKIIFLTVADDEDEILEVIRSGAVGYLLKDVEPSELTRAIYNVMEGKPVLHPIATQRLLGELNKLNLPPERDAGLEQLTEREKDVLILIAQGKSNRDIAHSLFISEKTVKNHITSIFRKLKVDDRTQAAIYAIKKGFVEV